MAEDDGPGTGETMTNHGTIDDLKITKNKIVMIDDLRPCGMVHSLCLWCRRKLHFIQTSSSNMKDFFFLNTTLLATPPSPPPAE